MRRSLVAALLVVLALPAAASGARVVTLWHALDPVLERELAAAATGFNAAQDEFRIALRRAGDSVPRDAQRLALPFSTARPVLYFNRDAFRRAGLDPDAPPRTWYGMARTLGALADAGQACAYTTAWPSWVLLGANGGQFDRQLLVRWVSMLASWQSAGYFRYSGRLDEAETRFAAGECAVLTGSSASAAEIARRARFDVGVAPLPRYDDFAPAASGLPSGADALWAERRSVGVAKFFAFLAARAATLRRERAAIDRALEAVWSGSRTPVDALSLVRY
jgi:ABC-type glycerol-3-phosphate transport system substrate-binding protein